MAQFRIKGSALAVAAAIACFSSETALAEKTTLEEVIVTAQKREQSLQDIPIAVSALDKAQLVSLGINSIDALGSGIIPSLNVHPYGNSNSIQIVTIRGMGTAEVASITSEPYVAIYQDGFYRGRAQGLSAEIADAERIEVLRGPQGTLFGRNATGGAINTISKRPSGEFGIEQTLGVGTNDERRSVTHLNLPDYEGLKAKLDYLYHSKDGWVENTAPGENDFNAYVKRGGRLALEYQVADAFSASYALDDIRMDTTAPYFQVYRDYGIATLGGPLFGAEGGRQTKTRRPIAPLDWTTTHVLAHGLTLSYSPYEQLTLKSLTGYQKKSDDTRSNFGGALYYNGFVPWTDVDESLFSQEFQAVGSFDRIDFIAGIFLLRENAKSETRSYFSLDMWGFYTGTPWSPIDPPTRFDVFDPDGAQTPPPQVVHMDSDSKAVYGQVTWTPPVLSDALKLTVGGRYTKENKSAYRDYKAHVGFDFDESRFDPMVSAEYRISDGVSAYAKWSSAYQAGGANPISKSFTPYRNMIVKSTEMGFKSEFWERRARVNLDVFRSVLDGMQLEFIGQPVTVTETIAAEKQAVSKGLELDASVVPLPGLVIGASYTRLITHIPLQPNPLLNGALQKFEATVSPKHAGSGTIDYTFPEFGIGRLIAHVDVTSSSPYAYMALDNQRCDGYTTVNARLTLGDIPIHHDGMLQVAVWARNLTDDEHATFAFPNGTPATDIVQTFSEGRTVGLDLVYSYK